MAEVRSTNHKLVLISMNFGAIYIYIY